jgi:hypothetical protein
MAQDTSSAQNMPNCNRYFAQVCWLAFTLGWEFGLGVSGSNA